MPSALSLSRLGMINDLQQLEIIGHNLANANTPGYKRDRAISVPFDHHLNTEIQTTANLLSTQDRALVPGLVRRTDFSPGALQYTGNPLDVAIEGDAYFEMLGSQGIYYSRRGSFAIDAGGRLVNENGHIVNGIDGEFLLSGGEFTVDRDGQVHENGEYAGQLKIVHFADPLALEKNGKGMLRARPGQTPAAASEFGLRQGYREASNVQVTDEMVRLISIQRSFESAARVIKSHDEMVGTAISTLAEF